MAESQKTALIIGAGPAGLTAAYELLRHTDVKPIVFEASQSIGGISRTDQFEGNRIDIGGHRFFSKSQRVMDWWFNVMPPQSAPSRDDKILHREVELVDKCEVLPLDSSEAIESTQRDPEVTDRVMLNRSRLSRILFLRKFFDYPISLSGKTLKNLGMARVMRIGWGYVVAKVAKRKPVRSLEDFLVNQFGYELYCTFFRDYTEKVWGVPCQKLSAAWGAQRIKGLSLSKAILHALKSALPKSSKSDQSKVETSLIERFWYPKLGPGQLWEVVAGDLLQAGAEIRMGTKVVGLTTEGDRVTGVQVLNPETGEVETILGDYVFSSMPIKELLPALKTQVPQEIADVAAGLQYRDFMTVGVLARKLKLTNDTERPSVNNIVPDNWIYIQEPDVRVGRLQIFNNWSPYMVADSNTAWVGMEYFANEGDELWLMDDGSFCQFAVKELAAIGVVDVEDILKTVLIRVPKAYPAYFGSYEQFDQVKSYLSRFENLFLVGRNGQHRYNNQDHSMLTAMVAVDYISGKIQNRDDVWNVNVEKEYHESKS
ncbi:MAG: NAD(P)/FAD-dependent oxidoreductase [Armatimonadota bacterium]